MSEKKARKYPVEPRAPAVLTVDVGGSHVKELLNSFDERRRFASGHELTAEQMVAGVLEQTADWEYVGVSVGVPAPVVGGRSRSESRSISERAGSGFDFERRSASRRRSINDAAMQAFGSYDGGRMLFLGLGTGLGTTLIIDGVIAPMELGHLPYRKATYEDYVGEAGLERDGRKLAEGGLRDDRAPLGSPSVGLRGARRWQRERTRRAAAELRLGHNEDAFLGGFRLWVE